MAMSNRDEGYYRRRIAEERKRAASSDVPEAKAAHLALADMYERHLEELTGGPRDVTAGGGPSNGHPEP